MTVRVRATLVAATAAALSLSLAAPAFAAPADRGHDATREAIRAAVAVGVPGVTATARDTRGTWRTTEGVGDLRTGAPRSADDHYRIASITKTFVATVLLQLEAEGRLSLDDTVETWLPGTVRGNGNDGRKITLRQLLNHTSGLFDYTSDEEFERQLFRPDGFFKHRYDHRDAADLVALALTHEPDFAPGTSWNYSNTNYVLAGMVIEKVTGHSYGQEIDKRVIEPLGLDETSVPGDRPTVGTPSSRAYSKLARTATGPTYDVTRLNPTAASSAGAMISDSADLNRFVRALLGGRLLPPRQLKEMKTTISSPQFPNAAYGLGLIRYDLSCGVSVWGHSGGIHGSTSEAVATADGRHSLALNFNGDWSGDSVAVIDAEFCGT
ncbi:serine hydrolase domain-containing protein [Streptomyces sp. NPDC092369]|uniref:serine hydrolase domain-containing protein n=1 Tax=Streptomyces sp. NPDC092369 TaxID=3366015 RepID=UPI0038150A81